ncbi:DinB family protein [Solitalea lacus]|uniref:DinB family protein n=1 Tax=Solitalea lacus TaxID=2911172 RepID=UPI001EDA0A09|nr:DinB family protein [Solitalea lacus]UKJ08413.1 DinB family protein [Solitalea lacus]
MRPKEGTYALYFEHYIDLVEHNNVKEALQANTEELFDFIDSLPENKGDFAYAEGKWSLKEVLLHLTDAERIFSYRALRFSRNDTTPLPSFDENEFIENAKTSKRTLQSLVDEFKSVRNSTLSLFNAMDEEELTRQGISSSQPCTALALGYIIAGHAKHHKNVITDCYL